MKSAERICKGQGSPQNIKQALEVIDAEVRFCGQVLRRMALPEEIRHLVGIVSSWPTIPRDPWFAYGCQSESVPVIRPNCDELGRLDLFMDWLLWLETIERTVIFAKACGFGYRRINRYFLNSSSHETLRKHYFKGLEHILIRMACEKINQKKI